MKWKNPAPNWNAVAGQLLDRFFTGIRDEMPEFDSPLTVFGSAAIQLCYDEHFASADVDLMVATEAAPLRGLAQKLGVGRGGKVGAGYGLQICPPQMFQTTPHYLQRAWVGERSGVKVIVPHVRDVLIGKLHRFREEGQSGLVPKDRRAFERVRELSEGRPSDRDMVEDLQLCESSLRLRGDGTINCFRLNALDLFRSIYRRHLDLEVEVFAPVQNMYSQTSGGEEVSIDDLLNGLEPDRD